MWHVHVHVHAHVQHVHVHVHVHVCACACMYMCHITLCVTQDKLYCTHKSNAPHEQVVHVVLKHIQATNNGNIIDCIMTSNFKTITRT